jgi:hypothetical protein
MKRIYQIPLGIITGFCIGSTLYQTIIKPVPWWMQNVIGIVIMWAMLLTLAWCIDYKMRMVTKSTDHSQ